MQPFLYVSVFDFVFRAYGSSSITTTVLLHRAADSYMTAATVCHLPPTKFWFGGSAVHLGQSWNIFIYS